MREKDFIVYNTISEYASYNADIYKLEEKTRQELKDIIKNTRNTMTRYTASGDNEGILVEVIILKKDGTYRKYTNTDIEYRGESDTWFEDAETDLILKELDDENTIGIILYETDFRYNEEYFKPYLIKD